MDLAAQFDESRAAPVFVLGPDGDASTAEAIAGLGWTAYHCDASADCVGLFKTSAATICVLDDVEPRDGLIAAVSAVRGALVAVVPDRRIDAAIARGATHYVTKPYRLTDLQRALQLAERSILQLRGRTGRRLPRISGAMRETEAAARARIEARLSDNAAPLPLMLVAFTRLEMINTAFGRNVGDALLEAVAGRIEPLVDAVAGSAAILTRMSGAEFIVTLEGVAPEDRASLASDIVARVERPFFAEGHMVSLGCRIGIVESAPGDDATRLLARASAALAEARASDTSHVRALTSADAGAAMLDAGLQSDLRRALDRDEVDILFQPQVSVTTGAIVGVEALARWQHPEHGVLGAAKLFAVAERSDYVTALSAHVQRRAATVAAAWPDSLEHLRLAINLTAADIAQPGFTDRFFDMIAEADFPPNRLTLEITESGLMHDLSAASIVLADLRHGGCRVAIDDFGTGYSSLAYLKALPLDYLKIDKGLAQDITGTTRDRIVVRGVIDMARSLGLGVIAEGVETEEQLTLLAAQGCNYYQGFLFAEPLTTEALIARVAALPAAVG